MCGTEAWKGSCGPGWVVVAGAREVGRTHGCFPSGTGLLLMGNGAGSSTASSPVGLSSNCSPFWL